MASYRYISARQTDIATVANPTVFQSTPQDIRSLVGVAFQLNVGTGLTATVQVLGSLDGINYFDMGLSVPAITGTAITLGINMYQVAIPWVLVQVTPSAGSGMVQVWSCAKGI